VTAGRLAAQTPDTVVAPGFCWRARQLPRCATFPITDFSASVPLVTTRADPHPDPSYGYGDYPDFQKAMRWTVGLMRNTSPRRAHGVSIGINIDGGGDFSPSLEWRERFWDRGTRGFLDLTAGYTNKDVFILPADPSRSRTTTAQGLTASAAIAPIDLIGLVARTDLVFSGERAHFNLSVGAQTGSYGTVIVGGLMAAWMAVIIIAISGADF
jgi:hypothetical protein